MWKTEYAQWPSADQTGSSQALFAPASAATIMTLVQSAKLNGHAPYRYLKAVLERLPTQPARRLDELLPHGWSTH